jgi:hypothetical protein
MIAYHQQAQQAHWFRGELNSNLALHLSPGLVPGLVPVDDFYAAASFVQTNPWCVLALPHQGEGMLPRLSPQTAVDLLLLYAATQQISGSSSSCVPAAQASDTYGIRIAFRPDNPLSLLTWQQYSALISRISDLVTQHLQGPPLEALQDFNRERKLLVGGAAGRVVVGAAGRVVTDNDCCPIAID